MQQLTLDKIGLKLMFTFSQRMRTFHKILYLCQHNLKYCVKAAVHVIEGRMFPALQFLCHLK